MPTIEDQLPPITEKQFQERVVAYAQLTGWLVYHTYDSRRSQAGFPDLVLVRGKYVIFAELKSEKGRVTAEQQEWLDALWEIGSRHVEVYVWRPSDWDSIERILSA